ncbi:DUF975 family protein [Clostridiaceae bacterium OttesenSCG-928-D20]|nr:DUF975 family protein [Clostridiaceae bacterium OttesenSCG-928-D20]
MKNNFSRINLKALEQMKGARQNPLAISVIFAVIIFVFVQLYKILFAFTAIWLGYRLPQLGDIGGILLFLSVYLLMLIPAALVVFFIAELLRHTINLSRDNQSTLGGQKLRPGKHFKFLLLFVRIFLTSFVIAIPVLLLKTAIVNINNPSFDWGDFYISVPFSEFLFYQIPGFALLYKYRLAFFLLMDDEDIRIREAMRQSAAMMKGNKKDFLMLDAGIIVIILFPWLPNPLRFFLLVLVIPFAFMSQSVFYNELLGEIPVAEGRGFDASERRLKTEGKREKPPWEL